MKPILKSVCSFILAAAGCLPAMAQPTAFTYQGHLRDGDTLANGSYDLQFSVYDVASGGSALAGPLIYPATTVSNGLFLVSLDFGAGIFNGFNRWLGLAVRTNGGAAFVALSPRQPLSSTPYAIKAREAATVPAGAITGAMLADGTVTASKLQSGAALQNLLSTGSASVAPGGMVMSDDPTNAALAAQGYVRMPNAEMTLAAEEWKKLNPPAANAEFIEGRGPSLSVNTGTELLLFRFDFTEAAETLRLVDVIRYNPATRQWSKGAAPPQDVVAPGATAVWTGSQVILWGGLEGVVAGTEWDGYTRYSSPTAALLYSPTTDQWSVKVGTGAIPPGRTGHSAVWTGSRMIVWGGEQTVEVPSFWYQTQPVDLATGAAFDPVTGNWTALSTNGAPTARRGHVGVWTGNRMLIQSGCVGNRGAIYSSNVFNNGFSYNPASDTWSPIRSDGTSPRQAFAQAVWTGQEMFTYGGLDVGLVQVPWWDSFHWLTLWLPTRAGLSYNPTNDMWTFRGVPDYNGPHFNGRLNGSLTWSGSEVITWGGHGLYAEGYDAYNRSDGQAYNMTNGTWRTLPAAPLAGGANPPSVWMGNQLIVCDPPTVDAWYGNYVPTARAAYSPASNTWTLLPNYFGMEPLKQDAPSVVWTGKELIIWGGPVNGVVSNRGRRYNVATGVWTEISITNAPTARTRHSAVWTGSRMVVWGGDIGGNDPIYPSAIYSTGGVYDPATDTWTTLPAAPFDPFYQDTFRRTGHKAVWTSYGMIVVGGSDGYNNQGQSFPKTIARLSANLTTWTLSSGTPPELGRFSHSLATDGYRQVFLWGGQDQIDQDPISNGGRLIDAATLTDAEADSTDEPTPTRNPTMVWSGTEFIVWGGTDSFNAPAGGGGKFSPALAAWTPLSHGGPILTTTFQGHSAVWTGTEMLLWGGTTNSFGQRYNPRNDGWEPMAVGPTMRAGPSGVWTGTNQLLYLPALPGQGAIPELWSYRPPARAYFYLKQ